MKLHLIEQKEVSPGVRSFVLEPEKPVSWRPGQYLHYTFDHPHADSRGVERWFTISSAPYEKFIQITTRIANEKGSSFKKALLDLPPRGEIEAEGPGGKFTLREGDYKHVLIAGGIGITPYHSMLKQLNHDGKPAHADLLYASSDDNFPFGEELDSFADADPTLKIYKFPGRRISEDDLQKYVDDPKALFYLSGPEPMVQGYEGMLHLMSVDDARVITDYFPGY